MSEGIMRRMSGCCQVAVKCSTSYGGKNAAGKQPKVDKLRRTRFSHGGNTASRVARTTRSDSAPACGYGRAEHLYDRVTARERARQHSARTWCRVGESAGGGA